MADSNKTIVIASVLKPIDDSRLYEKIGLTLAASGGYQVHMIGVDSARSADPNIKQHAFPPFRRISLRRWFTPWRIFLTTLRLKPDLLIISTHELLYEAMLVKLFPQEPRFGDASRCPSPKYRSQTSQPCRTTSRPPFFVVPWM